MVWAILGLTVPVLLGIGFLLGWARGHAAGVEAGVLFEQRKQQPTGVYTQPPHGFLMHRCTPACPQLPRPR